MLSGYSCTECFSINVKRLLRYRGFLHKDKTNTGVKGVSQYVKRLLRYRGFLNKNQTDIPVV